MWILRIRIRNTGSEKNDVNGAHILILPSVLRSRICIMFWIRIRIHSHWTGNLNFVAISVRRLTCELHIALTKSRE
jgi:hypothetical protein